MIDTKTSEKLDSLLRMYYNSASTEGEKKNALSLFQKICSKNGGNPDEYMKTSRANPANEAGSRGRSRPSSSSGSGSPFGDDFDIFWEIFRRANPGARRQQYQQQQSQQQSQQQRNKKDDAYDAYEYAKAGFNQKRESTEQRRKREAEEERKRREAEEAKRPKWNQGKWGTLEFEMKEPMYEIKIHNGKRVILLNTLVRGVGTQNRWGTQNFCIYSETFNPDMFTKDAIYEVRCGKVQYFHDHYIVKEIIVKDDNGFYHTLYQEV